MSLSTYQFKTSPYSSHSLLLDMMPQSGDTRRVLDVGCGDGYLCEILAARGYTTVGIDCHLPGERYAWGKMRYGRRCSDLDVGVPSLPEAPFDAVVYADVLEHLREPERILKVFSSAKYLKPNGEIIASLPNSGNIYFRAQVAAGRFPQHDRGLFDRTHLHFYTWDGWRRLFEDAALRIEEVRVSGIPFELMFVAHAGLALKMERLSWLAARAWKKLFAYQFIVRARLA